MDLVIDNGKVVEPSKIKKAVAAVKRDTDAVIVLPHADVQKMVVHKLWAESRWLEKYKSAGLKYNAADNSFTITFHTYSEEKIPE